jgi:hypothetical protein
MSRYNRFTLHTQPNIENIGLSPPHPFNMAHTWPLNALHLYKRGTECFRSPKGATSYIISLSLTISISLTFLFLVSLFVTNVFFARLHACIRIRKCMLECEHILVSTSASTFISIPVLLVNWHDPSTLC